MGALVNAATFAMRASGESRAWVKPFQWLFFPLSYVIGITIIGYALAHHLPAEPIAMAIPLTLMAIIAVFERILPFDPEWNRSRGDVKADLLSILTVPFILETIFKVAGPVAVVWTLARFGRSPDWHAFPRHWPFWAQCALVVGFIEFVKYWFHRLGHESPFWWRLHSVHHAVKRVYLLNGFRIHPLYHLLTYLLGYFPCILLGAPSETLMVHTVLLGIAGSFQHCNIHLKLGALNYVFSTNEIHRWHHSNDVREGNKNYGAILSVFDVLFGTYYNVPNAAPRTIGMVHEEGYPIHSYPKQLLVPFFYKRWVR